MNINRIHPEFTEVDLAPGEDLRDAVKFMAAAEPDPAWSIRRFAVWYLRHRPIQQSAIPIHGPVDAARPLVGVTLYREPPFQVQLFIGLPGASTPRHSHPNVDSIEWHVAGESGFVSERNASFAGLMHIAAGEMHTAQAGAAGAAFLSMQKWLNGVMPSSVELDWEAKECNA